MLKRHTIHQSLLRAQTFLGVDRELCMCLCFMCIVLSIFSFSLIALVIAIFIFAIGYVSLLQMAREDLYFRKIYFKALQYKKIYSAQGFLYSKSSKRYS